MKYLIPLFIFLLMLVVVGADKPEAQVLSSVNGLNIEYPKYESLEQNKNHTFFFHVFNGLDGLGLKDPTVINCTFHLYYEGYNYHLATMDETTFDNTWDIEFYVDANNFTELGEYSYIVQCECTVCGTQESSLGGYASVGFDVTTTGFDEEKSFMPVAAIILLPMLLGLLFILAIFTLSEEHAVLKIILFLLAPIMFWVSLHIGLVSVVRLYSFPDLQNLIGTTTYWSAWVVFLLFIYFLLYVFITLIKASANEKKAKLEY